MANWIGSARTNYVKVADKEGLEKYIGQFGSIDLSNRKDGDGYFCFLAETEDGSFPGACLDEDDNEINFLWEDVCKFLEPGEVLVVQTIGAEKLRYLTGYAEAYLAPNGEVVTISICEIYDKARQAFGIDKKITFAEY